MKILSSLLILATISFAKFDVSEATGKGFASAGNAIGGWLILGIIIALVFSFLTRKK